MILAGLVDRGRAPGGQSREAVAEDAELAVAGPAAPVRLARRTEARRRARSLRPRPAGKVCLDVGASTGGFTDCLLQRGAARVYAVDVGYGQLDAKLRGDPRVLVREKVNARALS